MKICIYGAGGIGGFMASHLMRGDHQVSLIARGPHLAAIKAKGLTIVDEGKRETIACNATDDPAELGPQDCVVLSLKAHSAPAIADKIKPLLGPNTIVVPAQNGIPWWYFYKKSGPLQDRKLESLDPGSRLWDAIDPKRVIGCVVYCSTAVEEPGVVAHFGNRRFILGEPDNTRSDRIVELSKTFEATGLEAPIADDIRTAIWVKLWGNCSFNPVSALTSATLGLMASDPDGHAVIYRMMAEARGVAEKLGVTFDVDIETRIKRGGQGGNHKTSMLQDAEAGRPMEIEPLVGAVVELGKMVSIPTPTIETVLQLVRLRDRATALRR